MTEDRLFIFWSTTVSDAAKIFHNQLLLTLFSLVCFYFSMLHGLAAPPIDPSLYLALGAGFVSQSDDVSLLVLCMPGVCYICRHFVCRCRTTLRRGHRAEWWVHRQLSDTADNSGQA